MRSKLSVNVHERDDDDEEEREKHWSEEWKE